jgi:hypothetical protein
VSKVLLGNRSSAATPWATQPLAFSLLLALVIMLGLINFVFWVFAIMRSLTKCLKEGRVT